MYTAYCDRSSVVARLRASASSDRPTHDRGRAAQGVARDSHGRIARSEKAKDDFKHSHPCPSTGKRSGTCPGYVIDHRQALKHGGSDQITRSDLNGSIWGRDDGRRSPRMFRPNSTGTAIRAQVHSRLAAQSAQKGAKERRAPTLSRSAPRKGIDDMMKWGSIIIPPKGGGM